MFAGLFMLLSVATFGQDEKESKDFQVSFVYPLGSNGSQSQSISNKFSFNILAGFNGGVEVFELGGVYNLIKGDVKGTQISGFGNAIDGELQGFQLAGFLNTNKGSVNGTQIAGFANLVTKDVNGIQLGGFLNATKESVSGAQISGFLNLAAQDAGGFQLAGFANVSNGATGSQVSGFVNKAKDLSGAQIGVVNIADSLANGIQIGLVNISKNGFISLGFDSDDNVPYQIAFRSGIDKFYTVIFAGVNANEEYWVAGAGLGSRFFTSDKKSFFINPEFKWAWITDDESSDDNFSHLTKVNVNVGYHFTDHFFITGGSSTNFYVTNELDENGQPVHALSDNLIIDKNVDSYQHQFWIGYNVGLGFKF